MNKRILGILLKKEFTILKRNTLIVRIIVMLPIMVMLIIPLVANMDIKNAEVVIVDNDGSELSRQVRSDIDASERLSVVAVCDRYDIAMSYVEAGKADVIVTIPRNFEADMDQGVNPKIHIAANGVNATKGILGGQYAANTIVTLFGTKNIASAPASDWSYSSVISNRYNPTLDFRLFMIPGLMVMLVIIICGFMPALNLVGEKESGTIEAINVTPVGKFTFVLSKLIPYWVAGLLVVSIGMIIATIVYGLSPMGNIGTIFLAAILFSLVMSGIGVTIANLSGTILQSIFMMFAIIIIFQLMSGLFTPIASMPIWAQCVTYAVPPRYFIEIMRAVYLKGATIGDLGFQFIALTCFAALFCLLGTITYKKQE